MSENITSIILIAPDQSLYPLDTPEMPKFMQPILNEPLLFINIKWLSCISDRIIIIFLKKYKIHIEKIVNQYKNNSSNKTIEFELRESEHCIGTFQTLKNLFNEISNYFIFSKGDIVTNLHPKEFYNAFLQSNTPLLAVFNERKDANFYIGDVKNNLVFCNNKDNPDFQYKIFKKYHEICFSSVFEPSGLYIANKNILKMSFDDLNQTHFKKCLLPRIVEDFYLENPVQIFKAKDGGYLFQCNNLDEYVLANFKVKSSNCFPYSYQVHKDMHKPKEEYSHIIDAKSVYFPTSYQYTGKRRKLVYFKNDCDPKQTIIGQNYVEQENVKINDSIIGHNCTIEENTKIEKSFIMDNVKIGKDCIIINSVIGYNVIIKDGSEIKDSFIASDNVFHEKLIIQDKKIPFKM